jgi:hypothetical protein
VLRCFYCRKGVANEQLAKIEQERGRRRERPEDATEPTKKLNSLRSESSNSSVSVATISTNASRSPRTGQKAQPQPNDRLSSSRTYMETTERKRRRSVSSDDSLPSGVEPNSVGSTMASTRSTRRKIGEHSPLTRGRRRSRTGSRSRHTSYSSSNRSLDADDTRGPYRASPASRPRRRDNTDPYIKQQNYRDGSSSPHRRSHQKRAKSRELEESSRKATDSNSMRRPRDRSFSSDSLGRRHYPDIDERYGTSVKVTERFAGRVAEDRKPFRAPPRDRSLSPFSKRLALTQAMNAGR